MSQSNSCFAAAARLVYTTELDIVLDIDEPCELSHLRRRLNTDRERLIEQLESTVPTAGELSLDDLFWTLRFSWADLQDYVEEANNKVINEARGFPDVEYCFTEDGLPCRPRRHFTQTLNDHTEWIGSDEYPITAWDEEDYEAATAISYSSEPLTSYSCEPLTS